VNTDEPTPLVPQQVYTAEQAAFLLHVPAGWLRKKASVRAVPCTFIGKHLRFSTTDINMIIDAGFTAPRPSRAARTRRQPPHRTPW
jgi:hypothetical protein